MFAQIQMSLPELIQYLKDNCEFEINKGYTSEELYDTGFDITFINCEGRNGRYNEYFILFTNDGFLCANYFFGGVMPHEIKPFSGGEYLDVATIKKELEQKENLDDEEKNLLDKLKHIMEHDKLRILMYE